MTRLLLERPRLSATLLFGASLILGCSDSPDADGTGAGGGDTSGLPGAGGGLPGGLGTGGFVATTGGSGGAPTSGGAASGGLTSGGAPSGGAESGGSGGSSGGSSSGGTGSTGSGGSDTGGSTGAPADPSAGCASPNANVSIQNALIGKPPGYDGSTPVPVVFAFHAAGNEATQLEGRFQNTSLGENYLMIYLESVGSGWTIGSDKSRYETAFTEVMNETCVDENRVFAVGHSSGAQFIVQLLCGGETRFDAIAPIASSVYCSSWEEVPTLNIHGTDDDERAAYGLNDANGQKDIVPYRTSNGCQSSSTPSDIDVSGCGSNIHPGCVDFDGCAVPTTWCNHDDPQYGTSNHGIPCFAAASIFDFFESLP